MKKVVHFIFVTIFTLSVTMVFADNPDKKHEAEKPAVHTENENKLTDAEIDRITLRIEEIRKMDKSDLTREEKRELKSELKEMKEYVKKVSGGIYIGGGVLILIIILLLLLA
jgi:peptidoglycan hydrolase CwlO-like protein